MNTFIVIVLTALLFATTPPTATIDGRGVTTLTWTQGRAAQVCFYQERLLFCGAYGAGQNSVRLGTRGPLTGHVKSGDVLTLREVGGGEVRVRVRRRWDVWMPLLRKP